MADSFDSAESAKPFGLSLEFLRVAGVVALLSAVVVMRTAASGSFTVVRGREYREVFNPTNPVRGEAIVGLSFVPSQQGITDRKIEVWFPGAFKGELEIEVSTADGRFHGQGTYAGSADASGWVSIELNPFGASDTKALRPLPGDPNMLALAVRGRAEAPQGAPNGPQVLLVARWSDDKSPTTGKVRVYVNSRRADIFIKTLKEDRCSPISGTQTLRFDMLCDISALDLGKVKALEVIRVDGPAEQRQTFGVMAAGLTN